MLFITPGICSASYSLNLSAISNSEESSENCEDHLSLIALINVSPNGPSSFSYSPERSMPFQLLQKFLRLGIFGQLEIPI